MDYFLSCVFLTQLQFRSPEEYAYKMETEKVDIYSLGNVFYGILAKRWPFYDIIKDDKVAQKTIMSGARPPIQASILNSTDPFDRVMLKAIEMCWVQEPRERATAREVQNFIDG
jgi:serine/threonine protein kinase